ncbi:MAG TPA: hypothetical protein VMP01_13765 [Pirellulaceae bacterium]|nr:hypothetical protein [Pirellulaceae bacterium]
MSLRPLAIILLALLLASPAAAKERTWTSADGRTMKAEFVREVDGVVTFLREGKLLTIPLDKLSEKDQQIVRDLTLGKPVPDEDSPTSSTPVPSAPAASDSPAGETEDLPAAAKITIEVRTWTDSRGIKTFAKFVRINGANVVLNRNGKILTVSFHSLSEDDQQYVRDLLTQQGKAELIPDALAGGSPSPSGVSTNPFPPAGGPVRGPGGVPGGPAGIDPGGMPPAGGFPGSGLPGAGGMPGAGDGDMPMPPSLGVPDGVSLADPPTTIDPSEITGPGLPGSGANPGPGITPPFGGGTNIPTGFPESSFPRDPVTGTFPSGPTFQQILRCTGCNREISQDQSKLDRCPHCNTIWVYKEDSSGQRQMTAGGVRNLAIGIFVGIVVVVLGGVAGFIGILVAIVRAVSRPSRANYRRY